MIVDSNPFVLSLASLIALGALSVQGCGESSEEESAGPSGQVLQLVDEKKLSKLLPDQGGSDWEASGVHARNGFLHIVFDNMTFLAVVNVSLSSGSLTQEGDVKNSQYEGITYDDHGTPHFYVVKETDGTDTDTVFHSQIIQYDEKLVYEGSEKSDAVFEDPNSGLEGIAWIWADDADHVLALCEANGCGTGAGEGQGRLKVLKQDGDSWTTVSMIALPPTAAFADYSDIAVRDRGDGTATVAIVSQRSSALWIGTLAQHPWQFVDAGTVYTFPRKSDGSVQYCDIEGVSFLDDRTFAMVSDKTSGGDSCADKDESVHIFKLP